MDININVRLQQYKAKATSSKDSVNRKKKNTSSAKWQKFMGGANKAETKSLSSIASSFMPAIKISSSIIALSKIANAGIQISGTVTNNRFRQKRQQQTMRALTRPDKFLKTSAVSYFERNFDIMRQNEQIDYRRRMAGMYLPFRQGDNGITN